MEIKPFAHAVDWELCDNIVIVRATNAEGQMFVVLSTSIVEAIADMVIARRDQDENDNEADDDDDDDDDDGGQS